MRRIACGGIVLVALAALCTLALPRGLADLSAFEARMSRRSWEDGQRRPTAAEWELARQRLAEAHRLDPGQPNYLEDIAHLHDLRAFPSAAGDPDAQENLRGALALERRAARLRPGSPYTWANIALLKSRLAEPDGEFEAALRNAALLGPWEPVVQVSLADLGFRHWNGLAPETRAALSANAVRTLRRQEAKLFELARRNGRLDVVCALPGVERSRFARACI